MNRRAFLAAATGCAIAKAAPVTPFLKAGDTLSIDVVASPLPTVLTLPFTDGLYPGMTIKVFGLTGGSGSQWVIKEVDGGRVSIITPVPPGALA